MWQTEAVSSWRSVLVRSVKDSWEGSSLAVGTIHSLLEAAARGTPIVSLLSQLQRAGTPRQPSPWRQTLGAAGLSPPAAFLNPWPSPSSPHGSRLGCKCIQGHRGGGKCLFLNVRKKSRQQVGREAQRPKAAGQREKREEKSGRKDRGTQGKGMGQEARKWDAAKKRRMGSRTALRSKARLCKTQERERWKNK